MSFNKFPKPNSKKIKDNDGFKKNTVLLSLIALFLFVKYNVIMFTQHRFQLKSENFLYNLPFHLPATVRLKTNFLKQLSKCMFLKTIPLPSPCKLQKRTFVKRWLFKNANFSVFSTLLLCKHHKVPPPPPPIWRDTSKSIVIRLFNRLRNV